MYGKRISIAFTSPLSAFCAFGGESSISSVFTVQRRGRVQPAGNVQGQIVHPRRSVRNERQLHLTEGLVAMLCACPGTQREPKLLPLRRDGKILQCRRPAPVWSSERHDQSFSLSSSPNCKYHRIVRHYIDRERHHRQTAARFGGDEAQGLTIAVRTAWVQGCGCSRSRDEIWCAAPTIQKVPACGMFAPYSGRVCRHVLPY